MPKTNAENLAENNHGSQVVLVRPVGIKLTAMLSLMVMAPMVIAMVTAYFYAGSQIETKAVAALKDHALEHQQVVDRFLGERIGDLRFISFNMSLPFLREQAAIEGVFSSLSGPMPGFIDLGVIGHDGRHLSYVGPHDLISQNYREEPWFKAVMEQGEFVSDMFEGFRKEPHIIVAVKNSSAGRDWIIRATINGFYLDRVVSESLGSAEVSAFLINREGRCQSLPPEGGRLMEDSGLGPQEPFSGVRVEQKDGMVMAKVWTQAAPWVLVHAIERDTLFAPLPLIRNAGFAIMAFTAVLVVFAITSSMGKTLNVIDDKKKQIQARDRRLHELDSLSCGIDVSADLVSEIKDTLLNIDLAARWIQDLVKNKVETETAAEIKESLGQIKSESERSRKLAEKFLDFIRTSNPASAPVELNELVGEVIETMEREIIYHNIRLDKEFAEDVKVITSDPTLLRQVFKNLLANSIMAVQADGKIKVETLKTRSAVKIVITDSGPGIDPGLLPRIFEPCFSAWPGRKGMGLGLATCANIIGRLGGKIHAQSAAGQGTVMTVELPL